MCKFNLDLSQLSRRLNVVLHLGLVVHGLVVVVRLAIVDLKHQRGRGRSRPKVRISLILVALDTLILVSLVGGDALILVALVRNRPCGNTLILIALVSRHTWILVALVRA